MVNTDSREIIGDVRYALATDLRQQYPQMNGAHGFLHTAEASLVKTLLGTDWKEQSANYYIAPDDGGGLIMVEVGARDDQKWEALASKDGQPVRVLTVGFDRSVSLGHPRHTDFEAALLRALADRL